MSVSVSNPEKKSGETKKNCHASSATKCRSDNLDSFSAISAPSPLTSSAAAPTGATGDATSDGGDGDGGGSDDGWQDGRHERREGDKGSAADLAGG